MVIRRFVVAVAHCGCNAYTTIDTPSESTVYTRMVLTASGVDAVHIRVLNDNLFDHVRALFL